MTRVPSNKPGRYWRDQGHYRRKAVLYAYAILTLLPHMVCMGAYRAAEWLDNLIVRRGHKIHVWAHPCLYADTSQMPRKGQKPRAPYRSR